MKTLALSVLLFLASPLSALTPTATPAPPTHAYIQGGTAGITVSGPVNPTAGQIVTLSFTVCNPTTYTAQGRLIVSLEDGSVPALAATTCFLTTPSSGQWFLGGANGGYSYFEEPFTSFSGALGGAYGFMLAGNCQYYSRAIRIPFDAVPGRAYKLNIGVTDGAQGACDADSASMGHRYEVPVVLTVDTCTATPTMSPTPTMTPTVVSNIRLVKSLTGPISPVGWQAAGYSIAWTYLALAPLTADLFEIVDTLPAEFVYTGASASSGPAPSSIVLSGRVLTARWTGSPAVSAGDAGSIQIDGYYTAPWGTRTINVASGHTDAAFDWTYSNPAIRYQATATGTNTFTRTPTPTPTGTMCLPCTSHTPTVTVTPTPTPDASLVDLQVTGFYITQYPVPACGSAPYTLGLLVYIRNAGAGFSGPFVVRVGSTDILVGGLLGGATDAVWFSGLYGPNNYTATIDATDIVAESDEANNSLNADVVQPTPPPTCMPNLTGTATPPIGSPTVTRTVTPSGTASFTHTPTGTPGAGGSATVTRTVTASGTATHTVTPTGTPVSGTATQTPTVSPTRTPFTPWPSGTYSFSPTLTPAVAGSGTVTPTRTLTCPCLFSPTTTPTSCGACSSTPTQTVSPTLTRTLTVTLSPTTGPSAPDLQITGFHLTIYPVPSCVSGGEPWVLRVSFKNNGSVDAGPFYLRWQTTDVYVAGLAALATGTVSISGPTGFDNCTVDIDATDLVAESDEANNSYTQLLPMLTPPPSCPGTATPTPSATGYATTGPTGTITRTATGGPTSTVTRTVSPTFTRTATGGITASATRTATPAPSFTRTVTPTFGVTPIVPGCVGPAIPGCVPSAVFMPVCGCNGTTYSNSSAALCAGIGAWTNGPCGTTPIPYPGLGRTWPYPVPATGFIYLGVELRTDARLRVEVLSSRLKLISVLTGDMPAGSGRMVLDLSGFAPGVYYYKMTITYTDGQVVKLAIKSFVVKR